MQPPQRLDATHGGEPFPVDARLTFTQLGLGLTGRRALRLPLMLPSPNLGKTWGGQDGGRSLSTRASFRGPLPNLVAPMV